MRKYNIWSEKTEPHHPNQNPAEQQVQDMKRYTSKVMDRTGAPLGSWFLCMLYVVMVMNKVVPKGSTMSAEQQCFGETLDISALLQFTFNKKVLYADRDASFPASKEKLGWWMGVAENKGDALMY